MDTMQDRREELLPGTHVEVLTKQQVDGKNACGTVLGAAPNTPDTYIVEYHPGLANGHHTGNELRVLTKPCSRSA
jgi:hypothetical protein